MRRDLDLDAALLLHLLIEQENSPRVHLDTPRVAQRLLQSCLDLGRVQHPPPPAIVIANDGPSGIAAVEAIVHQDGAKTVRPDTLHVRARKDRLEPPVELVDFLVVICKRTRLR